MRWRLGSAAVGVLLALGVAAHCVGQISTPSAVSSVNGKQGTVVVPTVQRQVSSAIDVTSGSATWQFPTAFSNPPTCWPSIASSASNTVFSEVVTTSISTTGVTITLQAAKTVINLAGLGTLTVWTNPPAGTTVTLSCVGALP